MEDKKSSKKFQCIECDYYTSRKSQWDRHILTVKHLKTTSELQFNDKIVPTHLYKCHCENEYKSRQGLWKHKKMCTSKKVPKSSNDTYKEDDEKEKTELMILTELVKDVIKQNVDVIKHNQDLTNKIVDICKVGGNTIANNNVHSNNKTFNLQFFLNETCKDAMNISEFISSIDINLDDLENTGRKGYVEGISNIFFKNLNNLETHMRPVHCSDSKREILYIKENNKWEKEGGDNKPILTKAIKIIANENIKQIKHWRDKYPDCTQADSRKNDMYLKIVSNSMNGLTEEEGKRNIQKIISNVAKGVIIDKY
jgi:hypothetical protein